MMEIKQLFVIRNTQDLLTCLLLGFIFFLPITISVAQPLAYASLIVWAYLLLKGVGGYPWKSPFFWPLLILAVIVVFAAWMGPRTEFSLLRSRRFLLLPLVWLLGMVFKPGSDDPRRSPWVPLYLFVVGSSLLAIWDAIRVPWELSQGVALYDTGNMRDPQLYMVGACVMLAVWIYRPVQWPLPFMTLALLLNVFGVMIHFKRGVWFAFLMSAVLMVTLTKRYRLLVTIIVGVFLFLLFPQNRDRLESLHAELRGDTGGRHALWTSVAPAMIKDYPWGTGFRAMEYEDFRDYSPVYIQPNLNHLHNNILQLMVDIGWMGCVVWLYCMGLTIFCLARAGHRFHATDKNNAVVALASLAAFLGLIINGVVEYNFGNSVIFMVFLLLMGIGNAFSKSPGTWPSEKRPTS